MQLLIKVGDSISDRGYKDGDVVDAFSDMRIGYAHAEMLCKEHDLLRYFRYKTSRYIFEKDGFAVIKRDLVDGGHEIITSRPNEKGEYIDVDMFIERNQGKIFDLDGRKQWFGGARKPNDEDLEAIWTIITAKTGVRREQHLDWPVTHLEKCHFLPISCCGTGHLSNGTVCEKKGSIYDRTGDEPVLVARRKHFVPYWDLGYEVDRVRDGEDPYDMRMSLESSPLIDETVFEKEH